MGKGGSKISKNWIWYVEALLKVDLKKEGMNVVDFTEFFVKIEKTHWNDSEEHDFWTDV